MPVLTRRWRGGSQIRPTPGRSHDVLGRDGLCTVPFFSLLWEPEIISRTAQRRSLPCGGPEHHGRFGDPPVPVGFATPSRAVYPASQIFQGIAIRDALFIELQK